MAVVGIRRWMTMVAAGVVALAIAEGPRVSGAPPLKGIRLVALGEYRAPGPVFDRGAAEIAAYDRLSQRVFVVNAFTQTVDVLDISNPANPFLAHVIDITPYGQQANSVDVHNGVVAVAVEASPKTSPGQVVFFNAWGGFLASAAVGALPDMLTFTPNGRMVLVANEGEPNSYGQPDSVDPEGSVSIVQVSGGPQHFRIDAVHTAGFEAYNDADLDPSIRIFGPGASVARDLEPEYIAVSHDSQTAWVTLQDNNALAILDLRRKTVTALVGLGFKDHSRPGNELDASDADGAINIANWPVFGMYMPDAIATFDHRGRTYLVTANEGDARDWIGISSNGEEARRIGSAAIPLDPGVFPNAAALKLPAALGRLNVTPFQGDTDHDGLFERLFAFGARSFSVWDDAGRQVYDSGSALERLIAARYPQHFNASHTNNTFDNRSDDKGPEPEAVTVAKLWGRTYAFVGLERIGGVAVYELGDPAAPTFIDYLNVRDVTATPNSIASGDLGPEGVLVVSEADSPSGKPLLVVANEISGTTRILEIRRID